MNFIDNLFLNTVMLLSFFYRKIGINTAKMEEIISIKLIMDNRRPSVFRRNQLKSKNELKNSTLMTMLISFFMGLFLLYSYFMGANIVSSLTLFYIGFIFLTSSILISDFATVLFDTRDNHIIHTKPIDDKTLISARILHILIYTMKIVLPISLPGLIAIIVNQGFRSIVPFIIMTTMSTIFCVIVINILYILIIRVSSTQKFQSIVTNMQVGMTILVFGVYQLLPRIYEMNESKEIDFQALAWKMFIPPYWFAEVTDFLMSFNASATKITSLLLTLFSIIIGFIIMVKYLAPAFNKRILTLSNNSDSKKNQNPERKSNLSYYQIISKYASLYLQIPQEKSAFHFVSKMMLRSRDFRLRFLPSIGYLIVFIFIFLISSLKSGNSIIHNTDFFGKFPILMMIYMTSIVPTNAFTQMKYSEKFKASWIYYVTPNAKPGLIFSGTIKSILSIYYLPIVITGILISTVIGDLYIFINIILGFSNVILFFCLYVLAGDLKLPFSGSVEMIQKGSFQFKMMIVFLLNIVLATIQYFVFQRFWLLLIITVISITIVMFLMNRIQRIKWTAINGR
jgi:ABC-2 type transport system permease protein